jgi:hypothetical protein
MGASFSEPGPKHTFWQGPWHYCARCDFKRKISKEAWERGLLLCEECQDAQGTPGLLGERDVMIDLVLTDGKGEYELAPVDKLRHPDFAEEVEDFLV